MRTVIRENKPVSLCLMSVAVCVASLTISAGCQNKNPLDRQTVSGYVTLDGAPVKQGNIDFSPLSGAKVGSGAVILDGQYKIATLKGLPPGKYQVRIYSPKIPSTESSSGKGATGTSDPLKGGASMVKGIEMIAPRYNTESKLTVEVAADKENSFNFDTKSN
jgi:hypothetical protein